MAVGLKNPWCHPIAYFLVDRVNAVMQAQIIKESINLLTDAGLDVHGVTFDGCAKNLATARQLGCNLDKFDGSFNHPTRPNKTLYVILDVCHMLELARNSLGDMKFFFTNNGDTIILKINMFDILNSKSKFGKNFKRPITLDNLDEIQHDLLDTISYLKELKDSNGIKLINGPRKTFILGFALSSKSILALAKRLLTRNHNKFEYLLTYRFSQDQLEMFFSKIRSRLGWNNNPNALQFKWALRALLQKNQVTAPETGNCTVVEETKLAEEAGNIDGKVAGLLSSSTIWHEDVLEYIGGYIARKITSCIKCAECASALAMENDNHPSLPDHTYCQFESSSKSSLTSFKTYGKLTSPSPSVVKVVKVADRFLRFMVGKWSHFSDKAILTLQRDVLQEVKLTAFQSLQQHSLETHVLDKNLRDDHITIIIESITDLYSKIFLYQFSKIYSERIVRQGAPSKRQKLTKLILFGND